MNKEKPGLFISLLGFFTAGVVLTIVGFITIPIVIGVIIMPVGFILAGLSMIALCVYIPAKLIKAIGLKTRKSLK